MASLDRIPSSSFCSPSARFITLVTIAIIGTTIVIVMMSVPEVRNTVTFKKTQCTVLNKTLETAQLGSHSETRGILTVRFIPRYDSTIPLTSCAFRSPSFGLFYATNQSSWLDTYKIGEVHNCYYSAELNQKPSCSDITVAMNIPYRVLVIVSITVSGICMLSVPVVVLIITLRKEKDFNTAGNRALFTPQNQAQRNETDQLLPGKLQLSGQIQTRYSTDEEKV